MPGTLHEANILADLRHVATVAVEADGVAVLLMNEAQDELRDVPGLNAPEPYLDLCRAHFRSLGPEERMRYLGDEVLLRNPPVNTDSPAAREAQTVHAQSYMRLPLIIDDQIVRGAFSAGRFNGTHLQLDARSRRRRPPRNLWSPLPPEPRRAAPAGGERGGPHHRRRRCAGPRPEPDRERGRAPGGRRWRGSRCSSRTAPWSPAR